jgi:ribonuclease J
VIRDRRHLSEDGMVLAVMAIHQQSGELVAGPDLISRGFMGDQFSEEVLEQARKVVLETLSGMNRETRTDPGELKEEVRKSLRRYFRKRLERHPVVLPYIIETSRVSWPESSARRSRRAQVKFKVQRPKPPGPCAF